MMSSTNDDDPFLEAQASAIAKTFAFPANSVLATSCRLLTPHVLSFRPTSASALSHHQPPLPNSRKPAKNSKIQSRTSAQTFKTSSIAFAPSKGTLFDMALISMRSDEGASWSRMLGTKSRL